MEKNPELNNNLKYYSPPNKKFWNCNLSNLKSNNQYWFKKIVLSHKNLISENKIIAKSIALLGYACDEGVRRNNGRIGAIKGPQEIRRELGKIESNFHSKKVFDFGDVLCPNGDMEGSQNKFSEIINKLMQKKYLTIGIGGGHDLAYAHFSGIRKTFNNQKKIGIINFDAHFDLRTPLNETNSGTPFFQILNKWGESVNYFAIGIQKNSNSDILYKTANKFNVNYISAEDSTTENFKVVENKIDLFIEKCDLIYVSVDLDGFSSSFAPGVSAPGVSGFSKSFFNLAFKHIFKTGKVIALDVVELNPKYDENSITTILAAQIINLSCSSYFA